MRPLLMGLFLLCSSVSRVAAQIPLVSDIFSKLQDVNTGFGNAGTVGASDVRGGRMRSVIFEVTLAVGSIGCVDDSKPAHQLDACKQARTRQQIRDHIAGGCGRDPSRVWVDACAAAMPDTTARNRCLGLEGVTSQAQCLGSAFDSLKGPCLTDGSVTAQAKCLNDAPPPAATPSMRKVTTVRGDTTTKTEFTLAPGTGTATAHVVDIEIGLSYGELTGFDTRLAGWGMTGTVQEFPVVATYFNFHTPFRNVALLDRVAPYLAVRGGISKLSAFRAMRTVGAADSIYTASGSTYTVGAGMGGSIRIGGDLFTYVEWDGDYRVFPSIEWAPAGGVVPAALPRRMRLSSWSLFFGVQLNVRSGP